MKTEGDTESKYRTMLYALLALLAYEVGSNLDGVMTEQKAKRIADTAQEGSDEKCLEIKAACSVALEIPHKNKGQTLHVMDELARSLADCMSSDAMLPLCIVYDKMKAAKDPLETLQKEFWEMWCSMGFTLGCPLISTGETFRSMVDQEAFGT